MRDDEKARPGLSRREGVFLTVSNLLIVAIVIIDLIHLSGLSQFDLPFLTLVNLIILLLALFSFRIKRRVRAELMKMEGNVKKDG